MSCPVKRIGLIVNPLAGTGGALALHGSDLLTEDSVKESSLVLDHARNRAVEALTSITEQDRGFEVLTCSGEMGESAAREAGYKYRTVYSASSGFSTRADTVAAAVVMARLQVSLLVFVGGDGTAKDIYDAVGSDFPVLGVPGGVKIQSSVFSVNPVVAGELLVEHLNGTASLVEREVVDLDEAEYRAGRVGPKLLGHMSVPFRSTALQNFKQSAGDIEEIAEGLAGTVRDLMDDNQSIIMGPGSTMHKAMSILQLDGSLLGFDIIHGTDLIARDVTEAQLYEFTRGDRQYSVFLSIIGGQGFFLGRGNQQLSPRVIRNIGISNLRPVATLSKLTELSTRSLLVDTGDPEIDRQLRGKYIRVLTNYREYSICRVMT